MDFSPSIQVQTMVKMVREFMEKEVYPLEPALSHDGWKALLPQLAKAREKVRQLGLFAPHMPQEYGGADLGQIEMAHLSEELGRSPIGHYVFNCQAPDIANMELLLQFGTEAQKEKWLAPLAAGQIRSCFLMTEPEHAGSNPVWMSTRARLENGEWIIRGHKWFATAVDGAAFGIVMAVTDEENANPYARASMIIVPTDAEGFDLIQNISVMGNRGEDYASHAEVMLHGVRVPEENLLGPAGGGFLLAQARLGPGRIHHAMRWIGICERAFDLMCKYAVWRELAPGKPLATRQTIQNWIAESRAEIQAARLMVLHAAWNVEQQGEFRESVSLIKFFVADVMMKVLDRAIQVHGALGMTDDTPLAYWYSHERASRIYDGADEVHKVVVARRILKGYGLSVKGSGRE